MTKQVDIAQLKAFSPIDSLKKDNLAALRAYPVTEADTLSPRALGSVSRTFIDPRTGKQYGGADARREGTVIGLPRRRDHHHQDHHGDHDDD